MKFHEISWNMEWPEIDLFFAKNLDILEYVLLRLAMIPEKFGKIWSSI